MSTFPLKKPSPDFEAFEKVLKGEKTPEKVYFVELVIDMEVIQFISKTMMGTRIPSFRDIWEEKAGKFLAGKKYSFKSARRKASLEACLYQGLFPGVTWRIWWLCMSILKECRKGKF